MRAAAYRAFGPPSVLEWIDLPEPDVGDEDVLIEVHACGVNRSDLPSREGTSKWALRLPWVLGAEPAGRVKATGASVEGVAVGDWVAALQQYDDNGTLEVLGTTRWGGYAELVRVPERAVVKLGSAAGVLNAAASQCSGSTAWSMVTSLAQVKPGETVFVPSASGAVACAAVRVAKHVGARVVASVGSPEKLEAVRALGPDIVFCYSTDDTAAIIAEATGGRGVDVVIETVGGETFEQHMATLALDGRLAVCGVHGGAEVTLNLARTYSRGLQIRGFRLATGEELRTAIALALSGRVRIPIAATFPFEQAAGAHELLASRRIVGKIVLVRPDSPALRFRQ
jgi:NADPH:quinone reductase-like Zn-dependent oxidoreductase